MTSVAVSGDVEDPALADALSGLTAHLGDCGLATTSSPAAADAVIVCTDHALPAEQLGALVERAAAGVPLLLLGPTLAAQRAASQLAEMAGVVPARTTPVHPLRLRSGRDAGEVTVRFDGDIELVDSWLLLDKVVDDVEVLVTAMSGLSEHAVMTWRPATHVGMLSVGSEPATLADPSYRRLVHRWVRRALGRRDRPEVRLGLLGFGAIGPEHAAAVAAVDGLRLTAVCDKVPARLDAARALSADVAAYTDADELLTRDDVDLVVISTPPNTHADWAMRALDAGKHVVVEKPFCLTTAEADAMVDLAGRNQRALAVYQNRRWDADFLTMKRVIRSGSIGAVFHYESFVGSYGHPCNFWHSDEEVSGGAIYDWGSHYLDWALDLLPQPVQHVTAATHKRVWHDVTNADHSRVTIRFVDGAEADFVHSDLAAAMKPKWYVLGTEGAVVGHWRHERVIGRDAIGLLTEDRLAASESPVGLTLHAADGSVTSLAVETAPRHAFHRELADLLLADVPMSVTPAGSRRNISVMEAASVSAQEDGRPVSPG